MNEELAIPMQASLDLAPSTHTRKSKANRSGPPNRMNDLVYRDWMKFQKSFFRFSSDQELIEECVYFFTKSVWEDGTASRTLILGASEFQSDAIDAPRRVTHIPKLKSFEALIKAIRSHSQEDEKKTDFVLVDLRPLITGQDQLDGFVPTYSSLFFESIRAGLRDDCYCCVIVDLPKPGGSGFPIPWAVGLSSRAHLRLRDEKVGLIEEEGRVFYCLFFQANDDSRPPSVVTTASLSLAHMEPMEVPAWIIPKPPPRRRNEVLHPAKFPETLIEPLIKIHSSEMDNVFDPMVGTGSTVIAALRSKRNGYGIDLSPDFIQIAKDRIRQEQEPSLFDHTKTQARVFVGDATRLDKIRELKGIKFQYAVTSPPYWSMLANAGGENQKARRKRNLPLVYSNDTHDLGNIPDYDLFLETLETVYKDVSERLTNGGVLTVVVKNIKRNHTVYPLAWDLALKLCGPKGPFKYVGTTLWCQDDIGLKPFAVGIYWVSNILHTYCLHLQKR